MPAQSSISCFFFSSPMSAPLWFIVRLYLGWQWLEAGWGKLTSPAWIGSSTGQAMTGFVQRALNKTAAFCPPAPAACHPDVQDWYAAFLTNFVLPYPMLWSYLISVGEVLVGIGLIVGCFVGLAAFFGVFMNLNFLLAGTVSVNPILATLGIFIILAHRVAGYWGADYYVLPWLRSRVKLRA